MYFDIHVFVGDDGKQVKEIMIYKTLRLDANSIQEQTTTRENSSIPTATEHNAQARLEHNKTRIGKRVNTSSSNKLVKSIPPPKIKSGLSYSVKSKIEKERKKRKETCKELYTLRVDKVF